MYEYTCLRKDESKDGVRARAGIVHTRGSRDTILVSKNHQLLDGRVVGDLMHR